MRNMAISTCPFFDARGSGVFPFYSNQEKMKHPSINETAHMCVDPKSLCGDSFGNVIPSDIRGFSSVKQFFITRL